MQLQTTSPPESKFPNEYTDVISFKSINIWKSYCKNTKGSRLYESRCSLQILRCSRLHSWSVLCGIIKTCDNVIMLLLLVSVVCCCAHIATLYWQT